jgi:hypothetical protein
MPKEGEVLLRGDRVDGVSAEAKLKTQIKIRSRIRIRRGRGCETQFFKVEPLSPALSPRAGREGRRRRKHEPYILPAGDFRPMKNSVSHPGPGDAMLLSWYGRGGMV